MSTVNRLATQLALSVLLAACGGDALVYGERTSVDIASLRLGDDAAQPIRINLGFDRQVVTVAPPLGGTTIEPDADGEGSRVVAKGEAVSQFSTFTVGAEPAFVGGDQARNDLLRVQSRFASGAAALAIADKPEVVAAVIGATAFAPDATTDALEAVFAANPAAIAKARAFLVTNAPQVSFAEMRVGREHAQLRRDVLAHITQ